MMIEMSEHQLAALRERIRRAGRSTQRLRNWLALPMVLGPLFVLAYLAESWSGGQRSSPLVIGEAVRACASTFVGQAASTALFLSMPVGAAYRLARRAQLRRRLTALTPSERAAVLLPLREETGDTRKIVRPLLRQLRIPTEPVPADAPAGRGDEASAAE